MRLARPAAILVLALLLVSGAGAATRAQSSSTLAAPHELCTASSCARDEPPQRHVHAHAVVRVAARRRREPLRVPARHLPDVRVRRAARPQDDAHAGGLARHRAAVDHRHAVLALRARPRPRAERAPTPWSDALRLQHALDEPADAARGAARADSLDAGRRRDGVPGLVPRAEQDLQDADDRRRRARVLHASTRIRPGPAPCTGASARCARSTASTSRTTRATACPTTSFGPWSPVYTSTNTPFAGGALGRRRDDLRHDLDRDDTRRASPHARVLVQRRHGPSGTPTELYRVYVATDRDCVNIVFRGAVVGSPAYAPRWNGTLALPSTIAAQTAARDEVPASAGAEGLTSMADTRP